MPGITIPQKPSLRPVSDTPERLAVSIDTAAQMLSVSVRTIRNMMNRGELQSRKAGKRTLIPTESLRRFVEGTNAGGCENNIRYTRFRRKGQLMPHVTKTLAVRYQDNFDKLAANLVQIYHLQGFPLIAKLIRVLADEQRASLNFLMNAPCEHDPEHVIFGVTGADELESRANDMIDLA